MIDAPMRADADALEPQIVVGQVIEAGIGEGHVVQACLLFPVDWPAFRQRPVVDEDDPMTLVVVADKEDMLVFHGGLLLREPCSTNRPSRADGWSAARYATALSVTP